MSVAVQKEIKLEGRKRERRDREEDKKSRKEAKQRRERERLIQKRREIERTWKFELLRATASVVQRNAVVFETAGQCGSIGRKGYTKRRTRQAWEGREYYEPSTTLNVLKFHR